MKTLTETLDELETMVQIPVTRLGAEGGLEEVKVVLANQDSNLLLISNFGSPQCVIYKISRSDLFNLMSIDRIDPDYEYASIVQELYSGED